MLGVKLNMSPSDPNTDWCCKAKMDRCDWRPAKVNGFLAVVLGSFRTDEAAFAREWPTLRQATCAGPPGTNDDMRLHVKK